MNYILDTDTVSNLIKKNSPHHEKILKKLQTYSPKQVHISIFTKCELFFGLGRIDNRKKEYKKNLTSAVELFTSRINILDLTEGFAEAYALIRSELVNKGQDIGVIDTMIAAQAISSGYTLVTNNTKHYQRIQKIPLKLKLTNWIG